MWSGRICGVIVYIERMMSSEGINQLLIHSAMEFTCAMKKNYSNGVGGVWCLGTSDRADGELSN